MHVLNVFIPLPVKNVRIGDKVLDSSRVCQLKVLRFVLLNLLLSREVVLKLKTWAPVSFVLNIEELHREVGLQIDHRTMVKHHVEVCLLVTTVTSEEEVLRVSVRIEGALEV